MGNCFPKSRLQSTVEIAPCSSSSSSSSPTVRLYGSPTSRLTCYIRFALLYKSVNLTFVPSETPHFGSDTPVLQIGSDAISGSLETLLQYIEAKFPHPPLRQRSGGVNEEERGTSSSFVVVRLTALQHRSMVWHLERLVRWTEDLTARGGKRTVDSAVGSLRKEVKKLGISYSEMLDVMLEHAQMEEKVIFPILDMADPGVCKAANGEHSRDLPMMNGIKEDIKSIGVLDSGGRPVYQEALLSLSKRLKLLLERCKEHFSEEEKDLVPVMEAAFLLKKAQKKEVLEQVLDVMQVSHSNLLNFLLDGLLPQQALHYLDLIADREDVQQPSKAKMIDFLQME